jgi:hypothetical protein
MATVVEVDHHYVACKKKNAKKKGDHHNVACKKFSKLSALGILL